MVGVAPLNATRAPRPAMPAMHVVRRLLGAAVLLVIVAVAGLMIVPALFGMDRYVIKTGSMTGTYDPGTLVINKRVPLADVKVGDVITYTPPAGHDVVGLVTHRIHDLQRLPDGRTVIRTKGDANDVADDWTFVPRTKTLSRVATGVPEIGYVYAELNSRTGRMIAFAIPGLIIALSVLVGLWKEAGEEMRRESVKPSVEVSS